MDSDSERKATFRRGPLIGRYKVVGSLGFAALFGASMSANAAENFPPI